MTNRLDGVMSRESVILPLLICHWPFVICHLPFVIGHLSFVICHLSLVICHLSFERKLRLCRNPWLKLEDAFIHEPLSPLPLCPSAPLPLRPFVPLPLCPLIFVSLLD